MGSDLTIENKTDETIHVTWYGAAEIIVKEKYSIPPGGIDRRNREAVWYKVVITYKGGQD